MTDHYIRNMQDVERLAMTWGFLPFFACGVPGFSIEEHTPEELWFSDTQDGPWEWKGQLIAQGNVAYGKFFHNKAGFVSLEWLPDLINYRRSLFAPKEDWDIEELYDTLLEHESLSTQEWKQLCGYLPRRKAQQLAAVFNQFVEDEGQMVVPCSNNFEGKVTRLQMSLYVLIADFEYNYTKSGKRYGWGKARYTTPEAMYGDSLVLPQCSPDDSFTRMFEHLHGLFPEASQREVAKLIW
jgi:hypothetical protein